MFPDITRCIPNAWRPFFAARRYERMPQHPFRNRMFREKHWLTGNVTMKAESVPVIVSRFTFLVEHVVICCYQVTKLFSSKHCFASASSAKSPCHLGSQVFLSATFAGRSESESCAMCAGAGTSASPRFSVELLQPFRKISQTVVRISTVIPLCYFLFWVVEGDPHHSRGSSSSLRS